MGGSRWVSSAKEFRSGGPYSTAANSSSPIPNERLFDVHVTRPLVGSVSAKQAKL